MRILIIRHGDPDYEHDTLTEKGVREAEALALTANDLGMQDFFVSPMGRAQKTASYSIAAVSGTKAGAGESESAAGALPVRESGSAGAKACAGAISPDEALAALRRRDPSILPGHRVEVHDWLMEFNTLLDINRSPELLRAYPDARRMTGPIPKNYGSLPSVYRPEALAAFSPDKNGVLPTYAPHIVWDMAPSYLAEHPEYLERTGWRDSLVSSVNDLPFYYDLVTKKFDELIAGCGYERDGLVYRVREGNDRVVAIFCHLGAGSVLISHLMNTSPFVFLQGMALLTTSVSEFVTEEREKGTASFRALRLGDISHLYKAGERPSASGRFCELFENDTERH